MFDEKLQGSVE